VTAPRLHHTLSCFPLFFPTCIRSVSCWFSWLSHMYVAPVFLPSSNDSISRGLSAQSCLPPLIRFVTRIFLPCGIRLVTLEDACVPRGRGPPIPPARTACDRAQPGHEFEQTFRSTLCTGSSLLMLHTRRNHQNNCTTFYARLFI
jgi:hypothetical protein